MYDSAKSHLHTLLIKIRSWRSQIVEFQQSGFHFDVGLRILKMTGQL